MVDKMDAKAQKTAFAAVVLVVGQRAVYTHRL